MTVDEFWHGETYLFKVYQRAYYNNLYETAWLNGLYVNTALNIALSNAFAKKGAKPLQYPKEPHNPFKGAEKAKTAEQKEKKFRSMMRDINLWIESGATNSLD